MTNNTENFCNEIRERLRQVRGTRCCRMCHELMDKSGDGKLCCKVSHRANIYRPSARSVNPLRS